MRVIRLFIGPELKDVLHKTHKPIDEGVDHALERLIKLGHLALEFEESTNRYEFASVRIKAMEENLPLLESDVPRLREALEQAAIDKERMTKALDQTSEGLRSVEGA